LLLFQVVLFLLFPVKFYLKDASVQWAQICINTFSYVVKKVVMACLCYI